MLQEANVAYEIAQQRTTSVQNHYNCTT